MNKLTQEFIRPYVKEYIKLQRPDYSQRTVDVVTDNTLEVDNGMPFALRNYIFGRLQARIVELEMEQPTTNCSQMKGVNDERTRRL